jgi:hypothetical protein
MKSAKLVKYSAGMLITAIFSTLVACGNKGGNDAPPPVVVQNQCGVNIQCRNGIPINTGGSQLFQAESQDWYGMIKLNWNFTAQGQIQNPMQNQFPQQNQYPQYGSNNGYNSGFNNGYNNGFNNGYNGSYTTGYNNGTSPVISYNGPVAANGTMTILQGMSLGMCQLPGGSYGLSTITPGQWSSAMVYNLRMQASGPASVVMTLSQGMVSAKTGSQLGSTWSEIAAVGRIFGTVNIESVNGYPCNMSVTLQ